MDKTAAIQRKNKRARPANRGSRSKVRCDKALSTRLTSRGYQFESQKKADVSEHYRFDVNMPTI